MKKNKSESKSILLILGIIYLFITILAVISYVSTMKNISNTPVTFSSVIGSIWWQLIMIIMFVITYAVYGKNKMLGALLETVMGVAMLTYILVSIVTLGTNFIAILIQIIYPAMLIVHGLKTFKYAKKKLN